MKKVLFILGNLADSDIDWLAAHGQRRDFAAGDVLIHEGQSVDVVHMLLEGKLAVRTRASSTDIAELSPGEIIGELSFLDARPPNATVTAISAAATLAIARDALAVKLRRDNAFAARFYKALGVLLADRLRSTVKRLGYSEDAPRQSAVADEIEPGLLEASALAGQRFAFLLERFKHS